MSSESITSLHVLLPLVLAPAILVGQLLRRFGLPAVVGQILVGIVAGPVGFGLISNGENGNVQSNGFMHLADIGLCVLLFKIGLETRIHRFTRVWREAVTVAIAGMVLPFGLGFGAGLLLQWSFGAALFLGAALTATSIGVTASVIDELGTRDSKEARIIMGAAVVDDVLGLLLLSALTALSRDSGNIVFALGKSLSHAVLFLGLAIAVGPFVVRLFDQLTDWLKSEVVLVALAFGYLMLMAHFAETAGLAAIIGSYAAGLVFTKREEATLEKAFEPLTELLTPIFFILIGSSISFEGGLPSGVSGVLLVTVVAIGTKMAAPWLSPNLEGSRLTVGGGLVPRGEVGLVFAQAGLATAVLSQAQYSEVALVLVTTTVVGPVLFRFCAKRQARIQSEIG